VRDIRRLLRWGALALLAPVALRCGAAATRPQTVYDNAELKTAWRAAADARAQAEVRYEQDVRLAYDQAFDTYHAARRAFLAATASNDVRAMNITLSASDQAYARLCAVYPADAVPADLPTAAPPADLRAAYLRAMTVARATWLAQLRLDRAADKLVRDMTTHPDFEFHTALLDRASTNPTGTLSLAWLTTIYAALVQQEPCTLAYWYGLGSAYYLQGQMRAANRTMHQAVELFPDSLYVHYQLARTCGRDAAETARAIAHLRWITARTQDRAWLCKAQTELARRYLRTGDTTAARRGAELAIAQINPARDVALLPYYVSARRTQCTALLKAGQTDKAVAALVDAARTAPRDVMIQQDVAALYFSLATADEDVDARYAEQAMTWLKKVAQISATPADVYVQLAQLCLRMQQAQEAEAYATQALASGPASPSILTTLGFVYRAQGRTDTARTLFEKALALDATCAAAREGLKQLDQEEAASGAGKANDR